MVPQRLLLLLLGQLQLAWWQSPRGRLLLLLLLLLLQLLLLQLLQLLLLQLLL